MPGWVRPGIHRHGVIPTICTVWGTPLVEYLQGRGMVIGRNVVTPQNCPAFAITMEENSRSKKLIPLSLPWN